MRLVAVTDWFDGDALDAATRTLWETATALRRAGHEVIVVAGGPVGGEVTRDRLIIRRVGRPGGPGSLAGRRAWQPALRRLCEGAVRESDAHAIWLHRALAVEAAAPVADRCALPLVCSLYATWEDELAAFGGALVRWRERTHRRAFEARACRSAATVLASSAPLLTALQAAHPRLATSGHAAPPAVDPGRFGPRSAREAERAALQLPPDACHVVMARHLTAVSGADRVLAAAAQVAADLPTLHLTLCGHGPAATAVAAAAATHPLGPRLRLVGTVSDDTLARWLGTADCVVAAPTRPDWTGLPVLEALACGTPVLATPAGDRVGRLAAVDPGLRLADDTVATLAAGLRTWCADRAALAALRDRCATAAGSGAVWTRAAADCARLLGFA